MCTSAAYRTKDLYFGRTLDYEFSYGEEVTVTPRSFPFEFRYVKALKTHYAMIGTAHITENYPLYYDAMNEKGLGIAGLNFVGNAHYGEVTSGKNNVAQFELIPYILGQCASVGEARELFKNINITDTSFSQGFPIAKLHWMISDRSESVTVEATAGGLNVYDNPVNVLTNDPPFGEQMLRLSDYMSLSAKPPRNLLSDRLSLKPYSRGMGALGLPGDLSSQSRFVRAAFVNLNSVSGSSEIESVSQFFHILGSVDNQRGCCGLEEGKFQITIYTSCCSAASGIYYYTSYGNHQISAVDMNRENLDGRELLRFPMITDEQVKMQN